MGWSGVWLVRKKPGESDEAAIDRTTAASIELRNGVPWIVPNDNVEGSAPDDEFIRAAAARAQSINPRLEVVEETSEDGHLCWLRLAADEGPVDLNVYRGEVQLQWGRAWVDESGSRSMWSYIKALAEMFDCVAHDPDYGDVLDLSLDEDEFAESYSL
jgi:hypothetical protein